MAALLLKWVVLIASSVVVAKATSIPSQAMVIGDGYNIAYGNTDGVQWQSGGQDPGIMVAHKVLQIETDAELTSEVSYHAHDKCQESKVTQIVYSPASYQRKLLQRITFDGQRDSDLEARAFTASNGYHDAKAETTDHHHVLFEKETTCVIGSGRYKMSLAQPDGYRLTNEIIADICALPEDSNNNQSYFAFINKWGTHVITGVQLGYRQTERYRLNASELVTYAMQKAPSDVSIGDAFMGAAHSYNINIDSLKSQLSFTDCTGQHYGTLLTGSDASPEPVGLDLTSIEVVFSSTFWQGNEEIFPYCPVNITTTIAVKKQLLHQALKLYSTSNGGSVPLDSDLTVPIRWPTGTYGLPKSKTGCPYETGLWHEGWIKQQPEAQTPNSEWTNPNHFDGSLTSTLFHLHFCVKTVATDGLSMDWPRGDYCIFKYHVCPTGFVEGYVQWDDDNTHNANSHGGTLPAGEYGADTLMRYCCRSDGSVFDPIVLPTETPFYLFQYKHGCQEVINMTSSVEKLTWDDDDDKTHTTASIGPVHPGMWFCNPPIKVGVCSVTGSQIRYCYYQNPDSGISAIIG